MSLFYQKLRYLFRFKTKLFYKMFTVILKLKDKINMHNIYKAFFSDGLTLAKIFKPCVDVIQSSKQINRNYD